MITDYVAAYSYDADAKARPDGYSAWVSAASYTAGDHVTYSGGTYLARTTHSGIATTPDVDTTRWELIDGTLEGAATVATGKIGNALSVVGGVGSPGPDYATAPVGVAAVTAGDFTIPFWLYLNGVTSYDAVLDAGGRQLTCLVPTSAGDSLYLGIGGTEGQISLSPALTLNEWQHVALKRTGSTVGVYRNKVLAGTFTSSSTATSVPVRIGSNISGGGKPLNGLVDELRFYNRALSDAELAAVYDFGLAAPDTTPPVVASASVNAAGTTLAVNFTEAGSPPVLPASGATGFTLTASNGAVTLSSPAISGTTYTATLSRTIGHGETLTLAYAPGNVTDSAATPNALASFSGTTVTNNSNLPAAPTSLSLASVTSSTINVTFNDNSDNETSFDLQIDTVNTFDFGPRTINFASGSTTAAADSLAASTTYYLRVRAVNASGNSDWSNVLSATTGAVPGTASPGISFAYGPFGLGLGFDEDDD